MDLSYLAKKFNCNEEDILLDKTSSMTNNSYIVTINGIKYIVREPGLGTEQLVDRENEREIYEIIANKNIADELIDYDKDTYIKITKYVEDARPCNPSNYKDLENCMKVLKDFHALKLTSSKTFDIFQKILDYEALMSTSKYHDYETIKQNVFKLKKYIDIINPCHYLTHIDPNHDNFLISKNKTYLIDWEYAGMQDQDVDIAMFCIYACYDKKQIDKLIDIYYSNCCEDIVRYKIYAYCAMCGLLWSNWCEYKEKLGQKFPEYDLCQYTYARELTNIALTYFEENL